MKKLKIFAVLTVGLLIQVSCANEDAMNNKQEIKPNAKATTTFAMEDVTATRTVAEYDGSGVVFYWMAGDRLWVNTAPPAAPPVLVQDKDRHISSNKAPTASFIFEGNFTANSYPVRYTGTSYSGDRVTIAASQRQDNPNKFVEIGYYGDCGTAVATKSGNKYIFTLEHKAAYLTFLPYFSKEQLSDPHIHKIRISADEPLAGTFEFTDEGINRAVATNTSNSIELQVNADSWWEWRGFGIPQAPTPATNAAMMVVAPGTYHHFTVEYILRDPVSYVDNVIIKKTYPGEVVLNAGKNRRVVYDLPIPIYEGDKYYMWDAQKEYWFGHENVRPKHKGAKNDNYAKNNSDARFYNETPFPAAASQGCKDCPNINEVLWYAKKGEPRWDEEKPWLLMGHLYKRGIWFKKKNFITGFNDSAAPDDGKDYRTETTPASYSNGSIPLVSSADDLSQYFFLPGATGENYNGEFLAGLGHYWTSTAWKNNQAYAMHLNYTSIYIHDFNYRFFGYRIWKVE